MHVFDISADALLHCYAVDEKENGEAIHLFKPMMRAVGTTDKGYTSFTGNDNGTPLNDLNTNNFNNNGGYQ